MKFKIKPSVLLPELQFVAAIAEANGPHPMLGHTLITVDETGFIRLAADNLWIVLRTAVLGTVEAPGTVTAETKPLLKWLRKLPKNEPVAFTSGSTGPQRWMQGSSGKNKFKFLSLDPAVFPPLENPTSAPVCTVPGAALNALAARTHFAVSTDENRYSISGALFEITSNEIKMVTTDGHRLAIATAALDTPGLTDKVSLLVPKAVLTELLKLPVKDPIAFAQTDVKLFFASGARSISARKFTGVTYPTYENVLPKELPIVVTINRVLLSESLQRVSLANDADKHSVHAVRFDFTENELTLSARSTTHGESKATIPVVGKGTSAPFSIGFSSKYLLEFLAVASDAEIVLSMVDAAQAGKFESGNAYDYYVCPIHLDVAPTPDVEPRQEELLPHRDGSLPTVDVYNGYLQRGKKFTLEVLAPGGLVASKGTTQTAKLKKFFLLETGTTDLKEITVPQWESLWATLDAYAKESSEAAVAVVEARIA